MAHLISWEKQRVCVSYSGQCSDDDILRVVIQLQADIRFDSTYQALHDFTECEGMSCAKKNLALEELAARNSGAARSNKKLRIAVVTDRPDVLAMLQTFEDFELSPYPIRVFRNTESANAWLNSSQI